MDLLALLAAIDIVSPVMSMADEICGMVDVDTTVAGMTANEVKRRLVRGGVQCGSGQWWQDGSGYHHTVDDAAMATEILARLRGERGLGRR